MGAPDGVPLALTYPGETLDLSIDLTAPNSVGTHRGNFVIKNPEGLIISVDDDSRLWLIIDVVGSARRLPGNGDFSRGHSGSHKHKRRFQRKCGLRLHHRPRQNNGGDQRHQHVSHHEWLAQIQRQGSAYESRTITRHRYGL